MSSKTSSRDIRRLETRARLFDTAITEIGRNGLAGADVAAIASAAGVVRGTFYFHFPTKEHVLVELQRKEESRIVADLRARAVEPDDLTTALTFLVDRVLAAKRRLGPVVFQDMLGLHFSSSRPAEDKLAEHPLAQYIVEILSRAQQVGQIDPDADVSELAVFFGTGIFALLASGERDLASSSKVLRRYVTTIVKGMETR